MGGQARGWVGDGSSYLRRWVSTLFGVWTLTVVVLPVGSVECLTDGFWRYLNGELVGGWLRSWKGHYM